MMVDDAHFDETFEYFERICHTRLKRDWLRQVLRYVLQFSSPIEIRDKNFILAQIFHQWKNADIRLTSEPSPSILQEFRSNQISQACVMQVTSLLDVGQPLWPQFRKLTSDSDDEADFQADPLDDFENFKYKNPKQVMLLRLSDGASEFRAIERSNIDGLSLLSCPGSKLLLSGENLKVYNGIILIGSENCHFIGGVVPSLLPGNRPLDVMARRLNKPIPESCKMRQPASIGQQQQQNLLKIVQMQEPQKQIQQKTDLSNSFLQTSKNSIHQIRIPLSTVHPPNNPSPSAKLQQPPSSSFRQQPMSSSSKSVMFQAPPITTTPNENTSFLHSSGGITPPRRARRDPHMPFSRDDSFQQQQYWTQNGTPQRKRKSDSALSPPNSRLLGVQEKEEDSSSDHFGKIVANYMRPWNAKKQANARIKIEQILLDMQDEEA